MFENCFFFLEKKESLESQSVASDWPVCFHVYKKPLYTLSSPQISQQTSGTAYIFTQVVHTVAIQTAYRCPLQMIMKQSMTFFFNFILFFKMQKLTNKSLTLAFVFQLMCWRTAFIHTIYFSNKYMSSCLHYNETQKITSTI